MNNTVIAFDTIHALCRKQGLSAVATMPHPGTLDMSGFQQMLDDGIGDMSYLPRQKLLRENISHVFAEATQLIAVTMPYQPTASEQELQCARYAAGKDYHKILRKKLVLIANALCEHTGIDYQSRACVDSAPLNERQLAVMTGIGWRGKNALIIHRKHGSYYFLGFLLTTAPIEIRNGNEHADRCGSCTRCEQSCPTQALIQRRVLSERCISYLTIEHHGIIKKEYAENFNGWWYGCDVCQEVCPWNRFALPAADQRLCGNDHEHSILELTSENFDLYFAGRPQRRIGYERFRRNLLVALWSLGREQEYRGIIDQGLPLVLQQAYELGLTS